MNEDNRRRPCRPRQMAVAALLSTGLALCFCSPLLAAGRPDPVEAMRKVARDFDLQTEMPKPEEKEKPEPLSDTRWHIPGGVASVVLYGAIAVAVGFIVFSLRHSIPGFSRRARLEVRETDKATILPRMEALARMSEAGDDADELARRGLFADAMHVLLLRSLAELRRRLDVTIADSLTSREILHRLALPDLGRQALGDLIQRVEFVHFGKRPAAQADYGAARSSFNALIAAMTAGSTRAASS